MPAPRFKNFIRRADKSVPPTGATRCGVHGDLKALLDPTSEAAAKVAMDMPAVMIKTVRYVGSSEGASPADAMGVKAHALYAFLMASARLDLVNACHDRGKEFLVVHRTGPADPAHRSHGGEGEGMRSLASWRHYQWQRKWR